MNGLKTDTIINRDALYALRELPEESVHCCVTSPPYYALRDYGLDMQIGREDTPEQYIDRLTEVFRELRRVLRSDGTLWLNIADTYCGTGNKGYHADPKNPKGRNGQQIARNNRVSGCKQKDLIGIPWLLAFALRADGWYLRSDIIWQKENPMPESVKDRPTRCYEHIFLLTKSKKYFYDAAAIAEPLAPTTAARYRTGRSAGQKYADEIPGQGKVQGLTGREAAATTTKPSCRPCGTGGTCGLSIPFPTRAGISPRSRQNLPKPVSRRAVRKAALCLTPFSAAARRGQPQGSFTGII